MIREYTFQASQIIDLFVLFYGIFEIFYVNDSFFCNLLLITNIYTIPDKNLTTKNNHIILDVVVIKSIEKKNLDD